MRLSDPLMRAFAPYFVGCTAVVAALATVTRPTRRDLAFATGGFALARLLRHRFSVLRALHRLRSGTRLQLTGLRREHIISSLAALRDAVRALSQDPSAWARLAAWRALGEAATFGAVRARLLSAFGGAVLAVALRAWRCLLYTSPSPRDRG